MKGLADKAYPDLEEAARERLALNQFLGELDKPQVAFGVRQGRPKSLDEAVSLTIELESYIGGSHGKPAHTVQKTGYTLSDILRIFRVYASRIPLAE